MDISTVAGRFRIARRSGVGCHASMTALHTASDTGSSVPLNTSGEYSKRQSVSGCSAASWRHSRVALTASSCTRRSSSWNTTRRNTGAMAL